MLKLHRTRLMPVGKVVLWRDGRIVCEGVVGASPGSIVFDAISVSVEDGARLPEASTSERILAVLAGWWEEVPERTNLPNQ